MSRRGPGRATGVGLAATATILALLLSGCSQTPEPEEMIEALTSVTEPPAEADDDGGAPSETQSPEQLRLEPLPCSEYLVVTGRGTGEPSKGQLLSPVARAIADARPGQVETIDIDYPADNDVNEGGAQAARFLIGMLNQQGALCPEQRFILLGYSQGAMIIGDALLPAESRLVGTSAGDIVEEVEERLLAIVLFANPRFTAGESYNVGDFDTRLSGLLPRPSGSLEAFADRLRDYCARGDFICQVSGFDLDPEAHMAYYHNGMQNDGAAFVITRLDPLMADPDLDEEESADADADADADGDQSDGQALDRG